jgi:hypothetical protein
VILSYHWKDGPNGNHQYLVVATLPPLDSVNAPLSDVQTGSPSPYRGCSAFELSMIKEINRKASSFEFGIIV